MMKKISSKNFGGQANKHNSSIVDLIAEVAVGMIFLAEGLTTAVLAADLSPSSTTGQKKEASIRN